MNNKTILITGGTGIIGKKLVSDFLLNGFKVITTSRSKKAINKLMDEMNSKNLFAVGVDLCGPGSIKKIQRFLLDKKIYPQILINNARNKNPLKIKDNFHITDKQWLDEYYLDVVIPYQLTMNLVLHKKISLKRVINISSIYGNVAQNPALYDNPTKSLTAHYGTAKAALIQLTKDLAVQLADKKITVNAVSFGGVKNNQNQGFLDKYNKLVPLRRMMNISEVSGIILMLLDDDSSYITGQNFIIDGGFTVW